MYGAEVWGCCVHNKKYVIHPFSQPLMHNWFHSMTVVRTIIRFDEFSHPCQNNLNTPPGDEGVYITGESLKVLEGLKVLLCGSAESWSAWVTPALRETSNGHLYIKEQTAFQRLFFIVDLFL